MPRLNKKSTKQFISLRAVLGLLLGGGGAASVGIIGQWHVLNRNVKENTKLLEKVNDGLQDFKIDYTGRVSRLEEQCQKHE